MRVAPMVTVRDQDRQTLEHWATGRSVEVRHMQRARIVLLAEQGKENKEIAEELGILRQTVGRWRNRYIELGLAGIENDAPGRGRKPTRRDAIARQIIETTLHSKPANATHWSTRTLAAKLGTSDSMVRRVWQANRGFTCISFRPAVRG